MIHLKLSWFIYGYGFCLVIVSLRLLVFSAAVTAFSNGNNLLFPKLVHLSSELMCLPVSNVTVKFLFSTIRAIKSKLRNLLAIPMVDAILRRRNGLFKV